MSVESLLNCLDDPATLIFSERLNHALDLALWPHENLKRASKLAKLCQVDNKKAFAWLNGLNKPEKKICELIADELQIQIDWLLTGIGAPTLGKHPVSGLISLPQFPLTEDINYIKILQEETWFRERFAVHTSCSPSSFVIYIENEQFAPIFPRDTRFVIDPKQSALEGDYILIKNADKQLRICSFALPDLQECYILLNETKPRIIGKRDRIIGVVVEAISKFL